MSLLSVVCCQVEVSATGQPVSDTVLKETLCWSSVMSCRLCYHVLFCVCSRVPQIFQKFWNLQFPGAVRVTRSKFYTEDPRLLSDL
jgi:hypothetical protein